jgi:hypothetical protein
MAEIWKDIEGYEGLYQVSNLGRVKSLQSRWARREKILSGNKTGGGYLSVSLYKSGVKRFYIHRLVAKSFILNPHLKPEVNHINAIKSDNNINNLEWCTNQENITHSFANNLRAPSEFQRQKIREIRSIPVIDLKTGVIYSSITDAEKNYKYSRTYLCQMLNGRHTNKTNLQYYNPTKQ